MAALGVRWSEHEARRPYARPFGVTFAGDGGSLLGSIAVSGSELLYLRHFQLAVLSLTGELFSDPALTAGDPQRQWLDRLGGLMPRLDAFTIMPASHFDQQAGRVFTFGVVIEGEKRCSVDAPSLAEYQEFQASLAHQTGMLYRDAGVEAFDDAEARQARWWGVLHERCERPEPGERLAEEWPWR